MLTLETLLPSSSVSWVSSICICGTTLPSSQQQELQSNIVVFSMQPLLKGHAAVADLCSVSVPEQNLPPIVSVPG